MAESSSCSPTTFVDVYGGLWVFMSVRGYVWLFVGIYKCLWLCMVVCGYL